MGRKKRGKVDLSNQDSGFGGSLGDLLRAQGLAPAAPSEPAPAAEEPAPSEADAAAPEALCRLVLRREKKGRRGKVVTTVEGAPDPKPLARDIGKAMGCGASVDGDIIVVQGDQRDRLRPWLVARGAEVRG